MDNNIVNNGTSLGPM